MTRLLLACILASAPALAHGGLFRPPPGMGPGDPFRGGSRPVATTTPRSRGAQQTPWSAWWHLNRAPFLRLRERVRERRVVSGTRTGRDPFDRTALRDGILLPVMLEALRDRDEEVRTAAAVAIGKFQASDAIPLLLDVVRSDKKRQVREAAMVGLVVLRDPALRDRFRSLALDIKAERRIRAFAVIGLGFLKDSPFLIPLMRGKAGKLGSARATIDELRTCATLALGYTGAGGTVPMLALTASDKDAPDGARGFAGGSIARLDGSLVLPDMLQLLRDKEAEPLARHGAAIALGRLVRARETGVQDFMNKTSQRDKDGGVRTLLAISLGRIGGDVAVRHLIANMKRCERAERGYYYLALGLTGVEDCGPTLLDQLARQKNADNRAACAIGLALLDYRPAIPVLRKQLEEDTVAYRPHGLIALGLLDDRRSIPLVQKILKETRDPSVRQEGAVALALLRRGGAIPELVDMLVSARTIYARGSVAAALGIVGDEKAVQPLLEIYRDRKRQGIVRAIALAALGRIGDTEDLPLLARMAVDLNPYVTSDAVSELLTIL